MGVLASKSRQAKIGWKSFSQNQLPSSNQELTGQQWKSILNVAGNRAMTWMIGFRLNENSNLRCGMRMPRRAGTG